MSTLQNIKQVILSITDDCNLRCKYCFVQYNQHYITLQLCKKIINLLNNEKITKEIIFFGGEPLLLWDAIIKPTVEYAKKIHANIKFSITTNGTLLNEERIKFLKNNNITILLSIDGDQQTQDYNRPYKNNKSNFNIILKNLKLVKQYLPNTTIRATIYPPTSHLLYDNFLFFIKQGFKNCTFCIDEFSKWDEKQIQNLKNNLRLISFYYLENYIANKKDSMSYFLPYEEMFSIINNNDNNNLIKQCDTCGLAYQNQTICINYEGKIFACQELSSYNNLNNNLYQIGDIDTGIDLTKQAKLWDAFLNSKIICENESYCSSLCRIKNICHLKFCHANSFLKFQNLNTKSNIICIWQNLIFQECLMIQLISKINNKNEKGGYEGK